MVNQILNKQDLLLYPFLYLFISIILKDQNAVTGQICFKTLFKVNK